MKKTCQNNGMVHFAEHVKSDSTELNYKGAETPFSDRQMLDHIIKSADVDGEQVVKMLNALYEVIQYNLVVEGQFKLKSLFKLQMEYLPESNPYSATTRTGVKRKYNGRPERIKTKMILDKQVEALLIQQARSHLTRKE